MEYHKIETLFERDEKTHKVYPDRLRNPVYGIIKTWQFTEKIDGTNIRIMWDGLRVTVGGRTDRANVPADLLNQIIAVATPERFAAKFSSTPAIIYGEGYGAGIQSGGAYSKDKGFIAFDVLVDGKWWLGWENTRDVAAHFSIPVVPFIGEMTLDDAVSMVRNGFDSPLAQQQTGERFPAEGLVGRTIEPLFDKRGKRLIIKVKTRDF